MLERDQAAITAAINGGPDHLPDWLFAGDPAQVLCGLRVHANTISHARLVALEETFPLCRDLLGAEAFNRLSRRYAETDGARRRALVGIGADFPDWLNGKAPPRAQDLARIEWAWLESYHAADAPALTLAELAGQSQAALLSLPVRRHPAAHIVSLSSDAAAALDPALAATRIVLLARPDAEVRAHALAPADAAALALADDFVPLRNLIGLLAEEHPGGGAAIASLIATGALETAQEEG
ncbi:DNA-binding domain-containing protein [uncultured Sphingopyxis sp.]|jgi:hypothetical protein|uniref:HvfC/BufC N-terminal domain-containing protein n=1 Tax=uncultured Sphingopyxis sp. TaxID=310581 RepID=UPI000AA8EAE0|nr:DNA-binding domain-containing protein [uncultured Sphingopyxis sp.]